jgi:hypothetical protein
MHLTTFEAVVENGQVRLPPNVVLPERQAVLVVVPDGPASPNRTPTGFRLANPEDASKFEMKVVWGDER